MTGRKDESFSIRMSSELRNALAKRAEREGRSVANLVHRILEEGMGDERIREIVREEIAAAHSESQAHWVDFIERAKRLDFTAPINGQPPIDSPQP